MNVADPRGRNMGVNRPRVEDGYGNPIGVVPLIGSYNLQMTSRRKRMNLCMEEDNRRDGEIEVIEETIMGMIKGMEETTG